MNLVGALPKLACGHEYILVIIDYATCFPEAIPLLKVTSKNIAKELVPLFSQIRIPKDLLTDKGTLFISKLMADLCWLLQVNYLKT